MAFKDVLDTASSILTTSGLLVGGGWAFWRYIVQKEDHPRIEFHVDVNFIGRHKDYWLVELLGLLENKGRVPYTITSLSFDAKYLLLDDPLEDADQYNGQVHVKHLLKQSSWLPAHTNKAATIDPGIKMRYNHIARLPVNAGFLLLHGLLDYDGRKKETRADRLVKVPEYIPVNNTGGA